MHDIEKTYKELDWESVNFDNGSWSWGRGGYPLNDDEYFIYFVASDRNLTSTRYKMPDCISRMLKIAYRQGEQDAKMKIKNAIGL